MGKIDYTGYKFITKQGYEVEILRKLEDDYWECIFNDDNRYKTKIRDYTINNKGLKNPFHRTCYGVGYIGCKKTIVWVWKIWSDMIERAYSDYCHKHFPTYKEVSVCEEWHNYKNFEKWILEKSDYKKGFVFDKDILVKGNKVYSPSTCCFVPARINILFTKRQNSRGTYPIGVFKRKDTGKFRTRCYTIDGKINNIGCFNTPEEAFYAYKEAKEQLIKDVAEQYKDIISKKVYEAMYNYKVEITD